MTEVKRLSLTLQTAGILCWGSLLGACLVPVHAQTPPTRASAPLASSWQQLSGGQKQALAPLASQWGSLTPQQQSKWLAISHNFSQMPAAEQATMHARMADWVALSPLQRNQARYNFNVVQNLPKEDKKAKWEAYQALSAEDKRLLSVGTAPPAKSAAPIAKPASTSRLVTPSLRPIGSAQDMTRSSASTPPIDRKTLLPKPAAPNDSLKPTDSPAHEESTSS
ncbi:MAG: DUF3106 domain-containing protein [Limnohabitans sp.]